MSKTSGFFSWYRNLHSSRDAFKGETCPYSFCILLSTECIKMLKCINVISIVQSAFVKGSYSLANIDLDPLFVSMLVSLYFGRIS